MSQTANHIQRLVDRKRLLEEELTKLDRELDAVTMKAAHEGLEKTHYEKHPFENHIIDLGGSE
jgi:prefoldin subunit 5